MRKVRRWSNATKTKFLKDVEQTNLSVVTLAVRHGIIYRTAQGWAKAAGLMEGRKRVQFNRDHAARVDAA